MAADALMTEDEVAAMLRVEPRTVRLWRQTRGLPFIRLSRKVVRFRRADVEAWLARQIREVVA